MLKHLEFQNDTEVAVEVSEEEVASGDEGVEVVEVLTVVVTTEEITEAISDEIPEMLDGVTLDGVTINKTMKQTQMEKKSLWARGPLLLSPSHLGNKTIGHRSSHLRILSNSLPPFLFGAKARDKLLSTT